MLHENDDLSWYARKADRSQSRPSPDPPPDKERERRILDLRRRLFLGGIHGSIENRTLYTRRLPPGCEGCLA